MRGCPNLCRFCHAGYTKRPLRLRSVDRILEIAEEAYWATGHDEIGLLSLSTCDYPQLRELAERLNERFTPRMVNISFPSLRVDRMLQNIPALGSSVRKAGLTIAVEAASDDLRHAMRKKVVDGDLLDGVRAAYDAGWGRVKLYFMAGFPGERPEDIDGIFDLSFAVSQERRKLGKPPAAVTASVGWLVPKPFTPLQWMAQPRAEYFEEVRRRLLDRARSRRSAVRITAQSPERSILEAVLARATGGWGRRYSRLGGAGRGWTAGPSGFAMSAGWRRSRPRGSTRLSMPIASGDSMSCCRGTTSVAAEPRVPAEELRGRVGPSRAQPPVPKSGA